LQTKYDVFISYKNTDEKGNKTKDTKLADKCYQYLTAKGLSVFHSEVSLESIGKAQYSNVIDDALDSSRFLIAVGCNPENLNARWVRYEWESFLNDIRSNIKPDGEVFVLYKDFKMADLPRALRQQQAFNAESDVALEKLYNFISSTINGQGDENKSSAIEPAGVTSSNIADKLSIVKNYGLKYVLPAVAGIALIILIVFLWHGDRQPYQPTHYTRQPQGTGETNGANGDNNGSNGAHGYEEERPRGDFLPSRPPALTPGYNTPTLPPNQNDPPEPTDPSEENEPISEIIIRLTVGSTTAYINDEAFTLAAAPFVENSRTIVPVRCIMDQVPDGNARWQNPALVVTHPHTGATYLHDNTEPIPGLGETIVRDNIFMAPIRVISNLIGADISNPSQGVVILTLYES